MSVTRRSVLKQLAAASDATRREKTSIEAIAATLDTDEHAVESHMEGLEACDLAQISADGTARVTRTGEELLELDTTETIIVDASVPNSEI